MSIELWALNTTAEDVNIRNQLYKRIHARTARQLLAAKFPSGTATKLVEQLLTEYKEEGGLIDENAKKGVTDQIVSEILQDFSDSASS